MTLIKNLGRHSSTSQGHSNPKSAKSHMLSKKQPSYAHMCSKHKSVFKTQKERNFEFKTQKSATSKQPANCNFLDYLELHANDPGASCK
jgi:hypothetical protein